MYNQTMLQDYKISTAYLRMLLQADSALVLTLEQDLVDELYASLNTDFIEGYLINRLFEAIAEKGLMSWIVEYGMQIGVGSHGAVGFAALSAPNLRTALEVTSEYIETRTSSTLATLTEEDGVLSYELVDRTGHKLAGRWLIESSFLVAQTLIETVMAHPLGTQAKIEFAYPRQPWHDQIEAIFSAQCHYDQPRNRLRIPSSWAAVPSPLSDADTFRANLAKAREIKLQLNASRENVVELVTTRLLNHFDRRMSNTARRTTIPTLGVLAQELHMSPRTLIRKLAQRGTAYQVVLEKIRREQAQMLLRETHYTAAEIAEKLGYQEPANFNRAFKRWTGKTPAIWRRPNG